MELIKACRNGDLNLVRSLIENGSNVNYKDKFGISSLIWASSRNHLEVVKVLIENGVENSDIKTSLLCASQHGHLEIIKYLVSNGADVNHKSNTGWTSLMWASRNGHLETVKYLIEKGAEVNHKDNDGETSLMWASDKGHLETVKYLIYKNADVNHKNNNKETSLIFASIQEHLEIIKYLISVPGIEVEVDGKHFIKFLPENLKIHFIDNYKPKFNLKCPWCRKNTVCDTATNFVFNECNICGEEKEVYGFDCFSSHACCKDCVVRL
jgi:hypothetical protein